MGRPGLTADGDKGYAGTRRTGFQLPATAKAALGEVSRIGAVLKFSGMVNAQPDFSCRPKAINGCSDPFAEVIGDSGRHPRFAAGMGSLPNRMTVEIGSILPVRI